MARPGQRMCYGDIAIEILDRSGKGLAVISMHHAKSIRWNAWMGDGALIDAFGLPKWVVAHGVQYPPPAGRSLRDLIASARHLKEKTARKYVVHGVNLFARKSLSSV